jgi:hypothetical protein
MTWQEQRQQDRNAARHRFTYRFALGEDLDRAARRLLAGGQTSYELRAMIEAGEV